MASRDQEDSERRRWLGEQCEQSEQQAQEQQVQVLQRGGGQVPDEPRHSDAGAKGQGSLGGSGSHDHDYEQWREEQARRLDK